jgi:hypothetical protein
MRAKGTLNAILNDDHNECNQKKSSGARRGHKPAPGAQDNGRGLARVSLT